VSIGLVLIAHGSRQPEANADLIQVADQLRNRGHRVVVASYLELAAPDIDLGGQLAVDQGATEVVLIPYFLSAGVHVRRDLAAARDRLAKRFPTVSFGLAPPLGPHPFLLEIIEGRVRDCLDCHES
jgi:sirohydrochlorin ferrochelatase